MAVIDFSSYRTGDIVNNLRRIGVRPLDVMVTGVTGAGKSTTLNSFFQRTIAKVGDGVDPETMELDAYELSDLFRVWDTPGLGDGVNADQIHKKKMINLLHKTYAINNQNYLLIDMCMVIIEGSNRDMGTTYTLLNDVIVPNIQTDRIFVVINQADVAMKGTHWKRNRKEPDNQLINFLEEQAYSIKKRIRETTGVDIIKPVYYSAEYGWNVKAVFDMLIDHMPAKKREILRR